MPEFNADGSLRIISDSYVWGDPLDYSSLTLAPLVSDQGQLKVIFTPTVMFTDSLATDPFDPQEILTEDQLEILTTVTNAVIDPDSKTITIPQPVYCLIQSPDDITQRIGNAVLAEKPQSS